MAEDYYLKDLGQFTGTEAYHDIMGVNATDGVVYVGSNGYSWAITDACVILKMKLKNQEFVTIDLKLLPNHKAKMVYSDGNGKVLYTQNYKYTDAKMGFKLFYADNVLMLAGEY